LPAAEPRVGRTCIAEYKTEAFCYGSLENATLALRRDEVTAFFVRGLTAASIHARIDFPGISLARALHREDFNRRGSTAAADRDFRWFVLLSRLLAGGSPSTPFFLLLKHSAEHHATRPTRLNAGERVSPSSRTHHSINPRLIIRFG